MATKLTPEEAELVCLDNVTALLGAYLDLEEWRLRTYDAGEKATIEAQQREIVQAGRELLTYFRRRIEARKRIFSEHRVQQLAWSRATIEEVPTCAQLRAGANGKTASAATPTA